MFEGDRDGRTYNPVLDYDRLNKQQRRVFMAVNDWKWHTLREISNITGDAEASISARLRDFRKLRFGSWVVDRRRRGLAKVGLHEYRLVPPEETGA